MERERTRKEAKVARCENNTNHLNSTRSYRMNVNLSSQDKTVGFMNHIYCFIPNSIYDVHIDINNVLRAVIIALCVYISLDSWLLVEK